MSRFLIKRVIGSVIMVWVVATIVFTLLRVTSDPVAALIPSGATEQQIADIRHRLGLDKPLLDQYVSFLGGAVTGQMAPSYRYDQPAMELVFERIPTTLKLTGAAMLLALIVAIPMGIASAIRRNSAVDYVASVGSFLGFALPTFWLGTMLMLIFAVGLRLLPATGDSTPAHFILPAVTLAMWPLGQLTRVVRSEMLDILREDYVRTARAKGLPEHSVIFVHALRNALVSVVTVSALIVGMLLSGAVVTESIFGLPGVGRLVLEATLNRDFPVIEACTLTIAVVFGAINLIVDVAYGVIDPRIRNR
jgi:peptide/nickel transport system permease protein